MNSDQPIRSHGSDTLDRVGFSRMIGNILFNLPLGDSLCIGLMGPWGSGKTSIINMVCEYVEENVRNPRIGIMRFSPWNFSTTEQVVSQFFLQLAEVFGVDNREKQMIGAAITRYAGGLETTVLSTLLNTNPVLALLSGIIKKGIEESGKAIEGMAFQSKSIQKQKDEIEELLKNAEEKIVIVIDDIDRLTDDQIRCVFQLVTVVCKFPNISYLLAFDRKIVSKALDTLQENKGKEFLDKVIQVPLTVPAIGKDKLFSIMASYMDQLIRSYKITEPSREKWNWLYGFCFSRLINTQRDIVRLCNGLQSKLPLVSEDVNFEDLVTLTILEQHEPDLYEWIIEHGEILTGQLSYDTLHDYGDSDQDKKNRKNKYKREIELLLQHDISFTPELALETLSILFPAFSRKIGLHSTYDGHELIKTNSVGHPLKFDRYFSLKVNNGQITHVELNFLMNEANIDDAVEIIASKDLNNSSIELFDEIAVQANSLSRERIEVLILSLQKIGDSLNAQSNNGLFIRIAPREAMDLVNDLLCQLDTDERYQVLKQMIANLSESNINLTSYVLNMVYIGHNQLMDDEKKNSSKEYPSLQSDEELKELGETYCTRIEEIRDQMDAYRMMKQGCFMHFYQRFPEGKEFLIRTVTADPERIIQYFDIKVKKWCRTGEKEITSIEITDNYNELITEEQLKQAIHSYVDAGKLQELDEEQQKVVTAYLMKEEKPEEYNGEIYLWDIDQWKKN